MGRNRSIKIHEIKGETCTVIDYLAYYESVKEAKEHFVQNNKQPISKSGFLYPELTLIAPAYNEQERAPVFLVETIDYFDGLGLSYELMIVADGCKDKT